MTTKVIPAVVGTLGTVKKGMVENMKKVSESSCCCDRDLKDLHARICTNPQEGSYCMNRMIDLSDRCSRCMVCTRLMHKRTAAKTVTEETIIIIIIIIIETLFVFLNVQLYCLRFDY